MYQLGDLVKWSESKTTLTHDPPKTTFSTKKTIKAKPGRIKTKLLLDLLHFILHVFSKGNCLTILCQPASKTLHSDPEAKLAK